MNNHLPLAERMRPKSLKDFVGQEHLVADGKILRSVIESDKLTSIILWGPPGTGKTTIARIVAETTKSRFVEFSAVTSGVADVRRIVKEAGEDLRMTGKKTVLFIDEIHRFNKSQQDAFLPHIENGTLVLIGATTENPGFAINNSLLSRSRLFKLESLEDKDTQAIIKNSLKDKKNGIGNLGITIEKKALEYLANFANGDARLALNTLEIIANQLADKSKIVTDHASPVISTSRRDPFFKKAISPPSFAKATERAGKGRNPSERVFRADDNREGLPKITLEKISEIINSKNLQYDRSGDQHYDVISAFIKSIRGSDPDAAIHYLARMLVSGEDPKFIARRLVIVSSEDIGNADPHALLLAQATADAVHFLGMPEARIPLAQCTAYLASAPKSNASYTAINEAMADIENTRLDPIPLHLRNAPTKVAKNLGHGKDYKYPHDFKGNYVKEDYLPKNLVGKKYYRPTENGFEKKIKEKLEGL